MTRQNLIVFDFGHSHTHYHMSLLMENWHRYARDDRHLFFVTTEKFQQQFPTLFTPEKEDSNLSIVLLTTEELAQIQAGSADRSLGWGLWQIARQYAQKLQASHVYIVTYDRVQLPWMLDWRRNEIGTTYAGIYFRPKFHYPKQYGVVPTWKEAIKYIRHKVTLWFSLANPNTEAIYCLDPYAVTAVRDLGWRNGHKFLFLPDPIDDYTIDLAELDSFKQSLGLMTERTTFLQFGTFDGRKGIAQCIEAIRGLPLATTQKISLVIAGRWKFSKEAHQKIEQGLEALQTKHRVHVVILNRFTSEDEMNWLFESCDIVLATYQQHVGSSGILVRAAKANKPVISQAFGLMGKLIVDYELGVAVDTTNPKAIQTACQQVIENPELFASFGPGAQKFAAEASPEQYAQIVFDRAFM